LLVGFYERLIGLSSAKKRKGFRKQDIGSREQKSRIRKEGHGLENSNCRLKIEKRKGRGKPPF
jgi:hypothetical protein